MSHIVDILSAVFLAGGAFFCLVGGIGLARMPDFYTRMHGASVTETLGAGFMLIGLMILVASPTATHALAKAALGSGLKPKLAEPRSAEEVTPSKP